MKLVRVRIEENTHASGGANLSVSSNSGVYIHHTIASKSRASPRAGHVLVVVLVDLELAVAVVAFASAGVGVRFA